MRRYDRVHQGSRSRFEACGMIEFVVAGVSDADHAVADVDFPGAAGADEVVR